MLCFDLYMVMTLPYLTNSLTVFYPNSLIRVQHPRQIQIRSQYLPSCSEFFLFNDSQIKSFESEILEIISPTFTISNFLNLMYN